MSAEWPQCGTWPLQVTLACLPPPASTTPPTSSPLPAPSVSPPGFNWDTGNINLSARYSQLVCRLLPLPRSARGPHLPNLTFVSPPIINSVMRSINLLRPTRFKYKNNSSKFKVSPILKVVNFSQRPAYSTGSDPRRWNPNGMFPHSL